MEFTDVLKLRQSTRKFKSEQIKEEELNAILAAANLAPVGSARYPDIHLTIVQDAKVLDAFCEAARIRFFSKEKIKEIVSDELAEKSYGKQDERDLKTVDLFYGAPTVIFISNKKQTVQPGIEFSNTMSVATYIHLAATDMGLGSCFMWGALESMRMMPEYDKTALLQLPEDFEPLIGVAIGYPLEDLHLPTRKKVIYTVNRIGEN